MQALKILGDAWEEEALEAQGKTKSKEVYRPSSIGKNNPVEAISHPVSSMPNTWDGVKEGNTANANMFMSMLKSVK